MTINDILYDEKQKAGEMLISECKKTITDESKIIGEYKGFEMELKFSSFFKEYNLILRKIQLCL